MNVFAEALIAYLKSPQGETTLNAIAAECIRTLATEGASGEI